MGGLILVIGVLWVIVKLIKEGCEPTMPSGYDTDRLYNDAISGMGSKQLKKNIKSGMYHKK